MGPVRTDKGTYHAGNRKQNTGLQGNVSIFQVKKSAQQAGRSNDNKGHPHRALRRHSGDIDQKRNCNDRSSASQRSKRQADQSRQNHGDSLSQYHKVEFQSREWAIYHVFV